MLSVLGLEELETKEEEVEDDEGVHKEIEEANCALKKPGILQLLRK